MTRANNFDALRLIAATLVVWSHSFVLTGQGALDGLNTYNGFLSFSTLGVAMFFAISGYLVLGSAQRSTSLAHYARKRMLRLYPALWVNTGMCIVLGWLWNSGATRYWQEPAVRQYLLNATALYNRWELPGLFASLPSTAVNGSLWTLKYELVGYVVLGLVVFLLRSRLRWGIVAVLGALWVAKLLLTFGPGQAYAEASTPFRPAFVYRHLVELGLWFMSGSAIRLWLNPARFPAWLLAVCAGSLLLPLGPVWGQMLSFFTIPVLTLGLAYAPWLRWHKAGQYGDFSYGLYIYAYPVQQVLMSTMGPLPVPVFFLLSMLGTLPLAIASWYLVEKPAISLK